MTDKPNTYIRLYFSNLKMFEKLSFEQVGKMIVGIMKLKARDEPLDFDDDQLLSVVAEGVLGRVDEDFCSYEKICSKNRLNGARGGAPKGNKNALKKTTETTDRLKTSQINKKINKKLDYSILEIVDYLNKKLGTRYKPTTVNTRKHIAARLDEGYTVEDFHQVIDCKFDEWHKTEYRKFLRPDTLFGSKFESYLNTAVTEKKSPPDLDCQFFNNLPTE